MHSRAFVNLYDSIPGPVPAPEASIGGGGTARGADHGLQKGEEGEASQTRPGEGGEKELGSCCIKRGIYQGGLVLLHELADPNCSLVKQFDLQRAFCVAD